MSRLIRLRGPLNKRPAPQTAVDLGVSGIFSGCDLAMVEALKPPRGKQPIDNIRYLAD
jgi:hypothetical protein